MNKFEDFELGRTDETIMIDSRELNQIAVTKMAEQCHNSIEIISRELDPPLFDTVEFVEAVKRTILGNQRAKIRILVFEPNTIVKHGHRLVSLAMQLSSFIEMRVPDPEYKEFNETLFIADKTGYLHRLNTERFEATVNFNDKRISKHLLQDFNEIWEKASPDMNLRKLSI